VNGGGPFWFLLDTGNTTTIIAPHVAARMAVAVVSRARLSTPSGTTDASYGRIDLTLGQRPPQATGVVIAPLASLRSGEVPLDGILGNDVLGRVSFALDVRRRLLTLDPHGRLAPRWQSRALRFTAKLGVATVRARAGDRELDLILDSGASRWVLYEPPDDSREAAPLTLATANGTAAVRSVTVGEVRIGRLTLGNVSALRLPPTRGRAGHGLLPLAQFRHVYVNNREGWIALK
jgi:hypothetical protein